MALQPFCAQARAAFAGLVTAYGLREVDCAESAWGETIRWMAGDVVLSVQWHLKDLLVEVRLIRRLPDTTRYELIRIDWGAAVEVPLWAAVRARDPRVEIPSDRAALGRLAALTDDYAADLLRGDWSRLPELYELIVDNAT